MTIATVQTSTEKIISVKRETGSTVIIIIIITIVQYYVLYCAYFIRTYFNMLFTIYRLWIECGAVKIYIIIIIYKRAYYNQRADERRGLGARRQTMSSSAVAALDQRDRWAVTVGNGPSAAPVRSWYGASQTVRKGDAADLLSEQDMWRQIPTMPHCSAT